MTWMILKRTMRTMNNSRIETLAIKYVCGIHNIHTLTQITIHRNTYKESIVFLSFNKYDFSHINRFSKICTGRWSIVLK